MLDVVTGLTPGADGAQSGRLLLNALEVPALACLDGGNAELVVEGIQHFVAPRYREHADVKLAAREHLIDDVRLHSVEGVVVGRHGSDEVGRNLSPLLALKLVEEQDPTSLLDDAEDAQAV